MTSQAKVLANRRNAKRSTGPRTAPAKERVRRNALRHGFAAAVVHDPSLAAEVERMALRLASNRADRRESTQLEIIAEAQVTLARIRHVRNRLAEQIDLALRSGAPLATITNVKQLAKLERYERSAAARRKRAVRWLDQKARQQSKTLG
jgi:hypothetical protein